jgi:hypothetical protein
MLPQQFLRRFLAISDSEDMPVEGSFASISNAKKEVDMYIPFVSRVLCFCAYYPLPTFDK